jgi:septum formation topological specificity factor MinE
MEMERLKVVLADNRRPQPNNKPLKSLKASRKPQMAV